MNILILSWRGPKHPNAGGAEISTHEHAKGWVKVGHQVTLFTSAFVNCKMEEVIDGVKIIRRGRQILGVQWEAFKWYIFGKHPEFDLVIDQFHGIPFFAPLYIKVKKLAFIHEVTKEVWWLNPWPWPLNRMVAFIGIVFEPVIFWLYRHIPFMTVSKSTRDDLVAWGIRKDKITIVNNGVKFPKVMSFPEKEGKKTLIFFGALSKDKGIEDALITFRLVSQTEKQLQFWVIGEADPRYLQRLKLESKKLGIDQLVKFWGFVNEKKKFELLTKAYLAINPSVREGWGLVVIEAAAMGTPTIGYNVPGLRDSIIDGKTGLLSKPTPESLAERVLYLLRKDALYKKLQTKCIKWSKQFNWSKSVLKSVKLVKEVQSELVN